MDGTGTSLGTRAGGGERSGDRRLLDCLARRGRLGRNRQRLGNTQDVPSQLDRPPALGGLLAIRLPARPIRERVEQDSDVRDAIGNNELVRASDALLAAEPQAVGTKVRGNCGGA